MTAAEAPGAAEAKAPHSTMTLEEERRGEEEEEEEDRENSLGRDKQSPMYKLP